jgi:hypothetical protein
MKMVVYSSFIIDYLFDEMFPQIRLIFADFLAADFANLKAYFFVLSPLRLLCALCSYILPVDYADTR